MSWWDEKDWIDPEQWIASGIEVMGTTSSMFWVTNIVTKEKGLFKPESNWRRSAYSEYAASKIGRALDIPCAKLLVGNIFGGGGCISMDVRKGYSQRVLAADSLGRCGSLLNLEESKDGKNVYDFPFEMSFQGLLPYLPDEVVLSLVKMLFFDIIIRNSGRHASNFSFAIDERRSITALLPLYDQGNAVLEDSSYPGDDRRGGGRGWGRRRGSAFPYYGVGGMRRPFPLDELIACLQRDYPETMSSLIAKARTPEFKQATESLECYDVIMGRVNELA